jgi:hypothetical protein
MYIKTNNDLIIALNVFIHGDDESWGGVKYDRIKYNKLCFEFNLDHKKPDLSKIHKKYANKLNTYLSNQGFLFNMKYK